MEVVHRRRPNRSIMRLARPGLVALLLAGPIPLSGVRGQDAAGVPDPSGVVSAAAEWNPGSVDELVWAALTLQQLLSERDYATTLVVAALNRWIEVDGAAALEGAAPVLDAVRQGRSVVSRLHRCRSAADALEGTLCALEEVTPLAPAPLARELAEEGARLVTLMLYPERSDLAGWLPPLPAAWLPMSRSAVSLPGSVPAPWALDPFQRYAEQAIEDAWRLVLANRDNPISGALDDLLTGALGFSPREGAGAILEKAPELQELLARYPVLGGGPGVGQLAADVVVREYGAFLDGVTGSMRNMLAGEADAIGLSLSDIDLDDAPRLAVDWALERSFVYLTARSAALTGDGGIADRIRAVGNAAVDLRQSAATFPGQLAAMGQQAAMLALGGNVFAVAAQVTSFFGMAPGGLGPDAVNEVRLLRAAMDTLRTELHDRFDLVEASLDSVLTALDTRFGRLEGLVATANQSTRAELASLHLEVLALGQRVERMEESIHAYMEAGFDREYARTMIVCLEHRERLLPPHDEMDFSTFSGCLANFRARAVQDARDALLADRTTPTGDAQVAAALADLSPHNLARRLPLLGRVAEQRFSYPGMMGGRGVANALEWAVAVQAYLTMLLDWPEHARSVSPGDLDAMWLAGNELLDVLRAITLDPSTGRQATLLQRVLDYYDVKVAELAEEAEVLAERHQQAQLRRVPPESVMNRLVSASADRPDLDVPVAIARQLPHEVRTAAVLALGEASLVYHLTFEDSVSRENFRRRLLVLGKRHDRFTFTRTRIQVDLRFGDRGTVASFSAAGPMVLRLSEEVAGDEASDNTRSWEEHVGDPGAHFLEEAWPGLASDPRAWRTVRPRQETLLALEAATQAELRRHASAALNNVFSGICGPETPTSLLVGADARSADRIREILEGMTAARRLLEAYVLLGLADAAEGETQLRESLFGDNAILDHPALCAAMAAGESPLRLIWLDNEPDYRSEALGAVLATVLGQAAAAPQPLHTVESTLQSLDAALRLQRLRTLAARAGG